MKITKLRLKKCNDNTTSYPKCTPGYPQNVPCGQRKIHAESYQWGPTTSAIAKGKVMVHDNSNKICMISPAHPGNDGCNHSTESVITEDALKAPEILVE